MKGGMGWLLALVCVTAVAQPAAPPAYPNYPIRLVVPFAPGGAGDVPARIVGQKLSEVIGQQVIIDNRPGAGSTIGAEFVAKAPPDGYTLLLTSMTHFVSAALYAGKLKYDALGDFAPISQITSAPNVLLASPKLPVKNVQELIALARSRPGEINFGSSGNGSFPHLDFALFMALTGTKMTHIPYRGSDQAMSDLLAGRVQLGFPGIASAISLVKAGQLRALAVSTAKRSPELPDVPTMTEAGVKGYEASAWFGIAAPKATPPGIVKLLHDRVVQVLAMPDVQQRLRAAGNEAVWQKTPEQFQAFSREESEKWAKVVKISGARADD